MFKNRRVRNPGSFGALFESHVDAVYEAAWLILRDRDQAAEVTRDAFADAWAEARSVPADMADMWVLARARDRAFDRVRAQDPARLAAHPPPAERPPHPLGVLLRAQIVRSLTTHGIPARGPVDPPPARPTTPAATVPLASTVGDDLDRHASSTAGQDPGGDGSTALNHQDVADPDGAAGPRQADPAAMAGLDQAAVRPGDAGDHPGHQAHALAGAADDRTTAGPTAETRRSHNIVAGRDVAGSSSDPDGAAVPRHADAATCDDQAGRTVAMAGHDQATVRPGDAGDHPGSHAPTDAEGGADGRTVASPRATTGQDHSGDRSGTVVGGGGEMSDDPDGAADPRHADAGTGDDQAGRTVAGSDADGRDDGRTVASPRATTGQDHGGGGAGTVVGGGEVGDDPDGAADPRHADAGTGERQAGRDRVASGFGAVGEHLGRRADPDRGGAGAAGRWWAVGLAAGVAVVVGVGVAGGGSGGGGGVEPAVAQAEVGDGAASSSTRRPPTSSAPTTAPPTTAVAARPPTPVLPSPRPTTTEAPPPPPTTGAPAPTPADAPAPAPTAPPPPPPEVTSLWGVLLMDSGCPAGEQMITLTWTSSGATSGRMRPEGGSWVAVDVPSGTHRACTVPGRPWQLEVANAGGTDLSSIRLGV